MPLYEYHCRDCGIAFEALLYGQWREENVDCPRCHSKHLERLPSTFAPRIGVPKHGSYRGACANPFENMVLEHAPRDEFGKKLKVNSLKELREKEKQYGFTLAAMSDNSVETPPQNEVTAGDIRRNYKWKWSPPASRNDKVGVSVGVASDRAGTLIDLPDSTKEIPT